MRTNILQNIKNFRKRLGRVRLSLDLKKLVQ